jgi:hypothetical protein
MELNRQLPNSAFLFYRTKWKIYLIFLSNQASKEELKILSKLLNFIFRLQHYKEHFLSSLKIVKIVVTSLRKAFSASIGSLFGGRRIDSLSFVSGLNTLPAISA